MTSEDILIFGYGSLMSEASLRATAPNAKDIRPAYITGFVRDFSFWDAIGWTESNFDVAGIPMCSLNLKATGREFDRVNGVLFAVSPEDYAALLVREEGQAPDETVVYDYTTSDAVGSCKVFFSKTPSGSFAFDNLAQMRYLKIALVAAQAFGDEFYREFIATTLVGDRLLINQQELIGEYLISK